MPLVDPSIRVTPAYADFIRRGRGEGPHHRGMVFDDPERPPVPAGNNADVCEPTVLPYVPPELDWARVPPEYNWVAVDPGGGMIAYGRPPRLGIEEWVLSSAPSPEERDFVVLCILPNMAERPQAWSSMLYQRPAGSSPPPTPAPHDEDTSMPVTAPPASMPAPPPAGWASFIGAQPPHVIQDFHRGQVKAHLIPTGDRITCYIRMSDRMRARAAVMWDAGVRFPGVGWDQNMNVFVSEVQHPEIQFEVLFRWCKFLGALCSGVAADLPPGVSYFKPQTPWEQVH